MVRLPANKQPPAKLVWRVTPEAPMGEYIDAKQAATRVAGAHPPVDPRENGLLASSLELLRGVRISEAPMDTLPGELIDEFMKLRR